LREGNVLVARNEPIEVFDCFQSDFALSMDRAADFKPRSGDLTF